MSWYPSPDSNREKITLLLRELPLPIWPEGHNLEWRVGFEPTALQFCRLLHWASLPPPHIKRDTIVLTNALPNELIVPSGTMLESNQLPIVYDRFAVSIPKLVVMAGLEPATDTL